MSPEIGNYGYAMGKIETSPSREEFSPMTFTTDQLQYIKLQREVIGDKKRLLQSDALFLTLTNTPGKLVSYNQCNLEIARIRGKSNVSERQVNEIAYQTRSMVEPMGLGVYGTFYGGYRLLPRLEPGKWYILPDEMPKSIPEELQPAYARATAIKLNETRETLDSPLSYRQRIIFDALVQKSVFDDRVVQFSTMIELIEPPNEAQTIIDDPKLLASAKTRFSSHIYQLKEKLLSVDVEATINNDDGYYLEDLKVA